MARPLQITEGLVTSAVAADDQELPGPIQAGRHTDALLATRKEYQFAVEITAVGTVVVEWKTHGTNRWVPAAPAIVASGTICCAGWYPDLRVRWAGNTGNVNVDLVVAQLKD